MDSITRVIGKAWQKIDDRNADNIITIQNLEKRKVIEVELRDLDALPLESDYGMLLPWSSGYRHNDSRFIYVRSDKEDAKIKLW